MSSKLSQKQINKLFFTPIINKLFEDGLILESDFNNQDILKEKVDLFHFENAHRMEFPLLIDHRETLIRIADKEYENDHTELGVSLYATYVEHSLNRVIQLACKKKKLDEKTTIEIIKNINIHGKCSWLLLLLDLPAINPKHKKTILTLSDERNSYFHYKWKTDMDDDVEPKTNKNIEKLKAIKLLLKYLRNYESKLEFKGKKGIIENISSNYR